MKRLKLVICFGIIAVLFLADCTREKKKTEALRQNWTHYVRTAGHGLSLKNVDATIKDAVETHLYGIEVDNDIPGRYESFLDPTEKLKAIKAIADAAHKIGNYAYVYIAGLECITANAEKSEHSFFKDHPDWVQRKITGEPAIFGGGTAFWIAPGDEDVWVSPYPEEWRKIYMERVRQIAATGIDGVYVDIPYWMTHFEGWEDSWASFDDYTVAAFKKETGLDAKTDLKLGDFGDPNFRRWVDFRIRTLTDFMREIDQNAKSVNPQCKTIAEIYPGYGEAAVRVGADVYQLYRVVDVIAHEYSAGGYTAAERDPADWFTYQAGMFTFRAFAGGKASWMLCYSWDGEKNIDPKEAMKNLAMSQVITGTNFWDARGHVMSGSNDYPTRTQIFQWIEKNEKTIYLPRKPIEPVGIYFSPWTRDYFSQPFTESYTGFMQMLLQSHREFQIVTPRTLKDFAGKVLILPDVKCISEAEVTALKKLYGGGVAFWVTGESGDYDQTGARRAANPIRNLLGIKTSGQKQVAKGKHRFIYQPACPGKAYFPESGEEFNSAAEHGAFEGTAFYRKLVDFTATLTNELNYQPAVEISASPFISAQVAEVDGKIQVFLSNFKGLKGKKVATQIGEKGMVVAVKDKCALQGTYLPFLGEAVPVTGKVIEEKTVFKLPVLQKGGIFIVER